MNGRAWAILVGAIGACALIAHLTIDGLADQRLRAEVADFAAHLPEGTILSVGPVDVDIYRGIARIDDLVLRRARGEELRIAHVRASSFEGVLRAGPTKIGRLDLEHVELSSADGLAATIKELSATQVDLERLRALRNAKALSAVLSLAMQGQAKASGLLAQTPWGTFAAAEATLGPRDPEREARDIEVSLLDVSLEAGSAAAAVLPQGALAGICFSAYQPGDAAPVDLSLSVMLVGKEANRSRLRLDVQVANPPYWPDVQGIPALGKAWLGIEDSGTVRRILENLAKQAGATPEGLVAGWAADVRHTVRRPGRRIEAALDAFTAFLMKPERIVVVLAPAAPVAWPMLLLGAALSPERLADELKLDVLRVPPKMGSVCTASPIGRVIMPAPRPTAK